MKILITTPILPPEIGGPATYVSGLLKHLKMDCRFSLITFTKHPQLSGNVDLTVIPQHRHQFGFFLRQTKLFLAILKRGRSANLIYAQGPVVVGLASILAGKILGKKVVVKFVGDLAWEEARRRDLTSLNLEKFTASPKPLGIKLIIRVQRFSLSRAAQVIVPSHYLKKHLVNHYRIAEGKIVIIPNAVEVPARPSSAKQPGLILASGRLVPHKNFKLVIRAFERLRRQRPKSSARLLIIGDGPEREKLVRIINDSAYKNQMKLITSFSRQTYLKKLAQAEVYLLASDYEGLPHAIIEAMFLGVPVVASAIPGNREVINNRTGILTKTDERSITNALIRILGNRKLKEKLTDNAKTFAVKNFSWQQHTQRLIHLFGQELA